MFITLALKHGLYTQYLCDRKGHLHSQILCFKSQNRTLVSQNVRSILKNLYAIDIEEISEILIC